MSSLNAAARVVHVRVEGRSRDVPLSELDLGPDPADRDLKLALARLLDLPRSAVRDLVVDRHATGNLTVRPPAVFG
jgi:hypothetical protein